jgi:polyhydroxyalkanoate synthesis regulator phasin
MKFINRKTIAIGAASLAVMVGAGSALALGSPEDNEAMLGDVAASLGVEQQALEDAIRDAQINRVDEAVAEGEITEERASELRERIESAETPLLAGPGGHHGHHGKGFGGPHATLEPAAEVLGLSVEELREMLPGTSLAAIAAEQGVAAADVEAAIVAAAQEQLDQAVADGRIDADRAAEMSERIAEHAGDIVEREVPEDGFEHGKHGFRGGHDGLEGSPPAEAPADGNETTQL